MALLAVCDSAPFAALIAAVAALVVVATAELVKRWDAKRIREARKPDRRAGG